MDAEGVEFVNGRHVAAVAEIDAADAVVAGDGSFPTLAIARGVPTVMYGQAWSRSACPTRPLVLPRGELYLDYIRYPFDVADGPWRARPHAARSEARSRTGSAASSARSSTRAPFVEIIERS